MGRSQPGLVLPLHPWLHCRVVSGLPKQEVGTGGHSQGVQGWPWAGNGSVAYQWSRPGVDHGSLPEWGPRRVAGAGGDSCKGLPGRDAGTWG